MEKIVNSRSPMQILNRRQCSSRVNLPCFSSLQINSMTMYEKENEENIPEWTTEKRSPHTCEFSLYGDDARCWTSSTFSPTTSVDITLLEHPFQNMTISSPARISVISKVNGPVKDINFGDGAELHLLPSGIISFAISASVRIDLTVDGAIRLEDKAHDIFIAINALENKIAYQHVCGQILQMDDKVDIKVYADDHNNKHAKMGPDGIRFISDKSALTFLTDLTGTKTSKITFRKLTHKDYTKEVFLSGASHGPDYKKECTDIMQRKKYHLSANGHQNWSIGNVRIVKTKEDIIKVYKGSKCEIKIGPNSKASLTTSSTRCTTSDSVAKKHMFVRQGCNRMHYNGQTFAVRFYNQSAGFDERGQIKIF